MLRSIMIVAAAAGLLAVGAMSALAGNSHGKVGGTLATSSSAARLNANDNAVPAATRAQPQAQAENDSETADENETDVSDEAAPAAPAAAPATNTEQQGSEHDD